MKDKGEKGTANERQREKASTNERGEEKDQSRILQRRETPLTPSLSTNEQNKGQTNPHFSKRVN